MIGCRLRVRAVDLAGNADQSAATYDFSLDTGEPQTSIGSAPPALTNDSTPSFGFSADEDTQRFECSIDQGTATFTSCGNSSSLYFRRMRPTGVTRESFGDAHTWRVLSWFGRIVRNL